MAAIRHRKRCEPRTSKAEVRRYSRVEDDLTEMTEAKLTPSAPVAQAELSRVPGPLSLDSRSALPNRCDGRKDERRGTKALLAVEVGFAH